MFTGIVEERGTVRSIEHHDDGRDAVLTIGAPTIAADTRHGASIAVNGVCLTVVTHDGTGFTADVMPQTLRLTALGDLRPGSPVNLERALLGGGRLDGHVVQGHVDGIATLTTRNPGPRWDELTFELPAPLRRYVAPQGSIALSGVSLTVTHVTDTGFGVALIPTTLDLTTLGTLQPGDQVNVEVDVLAKYVERMLDHRENHA
ncbi:riboflavin synthase, alpha subunit [Xylanimonas cellulosilytica DSM 15894]|uniref:Riboflavin synthase n=1 Tax=Xylanimonas cellulosilytica (strain DSM 15894 / JCM 12276 / CECT 5975 / KCTC 9989 / LMG 20990 / NBRC 107835 / XIL07) TaxID=446471 RepID=D1BSQ8_XYLCX|nr:riboflavin synthase [Xylanimonas cellulosilytica]ACZ30750.1 riboflavin synthase, alpha subunit [Xylanimonas cellulosilytica DSM 15894]